MPKSKVAHRLVIPSVRFEVSYKTLNYVLGDAHECCGYYVQVVKSEVPERSKWNETGLTADDMMDKKFQHIYAPLVGGKVYLREFEDDDMDAGQVHELDLAKLVQGLERLSRLYPARFLNIINENYDAEDADVFLQVCLFGEIRDG